jgi:hypothetical protein
MKIKIKICYNIILKRRKMKKDILNYFMGFIYFFAHYLGLIIVKTINKIFPLGTGINSLIDPIGFLALLTIFLIVFSIAKRIVWFIVIVGWILIFIRIFLMIIGTNELREKPSKKAMIFKNYEIVRYESNNLLS